MSIQPVMTESNSYKPNMNKKVKIALITTQSDSEGGAERFFKGLEVALANLGHKIDVLSLPAPEPDFKTICTNYQRFTKLDLSEFDVVISTKAPTYAVSHPNHIVYLVHTVRTFDDMYESLFSPIDRKMAEKRRELHCMDFKALSAAKRIFTIGHEVSNRLYKWRGLKSEVLHPPLGLSGFRNDGLGDYFFMPGRLHAWKRVHLVIEAVKASDKPLKLFISGTGEEEEALKRLAEDDERINFLGHIDNDELITRYAGALAVPFVPLREDYGYVTLEAFASEKPVLTCSDSGEPLRFVVPGKTGVIREPSATAVQDGLEWFFDNREQAMAMGRAGRDVVEQMSWEVVATKLVDAALSTPETAPPESVQVTTLDMQPIDPPVGGGRLRLMGLYHALGSNIHCHYVGTYDWHGEAFRDHWLSETLREISVPLSDEHHTAANQLAAQCNNKTVIDLAFSRQGYLSPAFIDRACEEISRGDVVVFSHPWVYPLVAAYLKPHHVVVYDSQNVEGFLRAQLLDESNPPEAGLLRQVVADEYELGLRADLILTCSQEDFARFNRLYEFDPAKMRVVPNGVMAFAAVPPDSSERAMIRKSLGLGATAFVAVFIGSPYGPNVDAAEFIANTLSALLPDVKFVIAGGVGELIGVHRDNLVCTGQLEEAEKLKWLKAADIAINPMVSGSGTNIKMFDFMALGLPVVVTDTGARGIDEGPSSCFVRVKPTETAIVEAIKMLRDNSALRERLGAAARLRVEQNYSWERISWQLGHILRHRARWAGQQAPEFSVIIPSYERHGKLTELMVALSRQIERNIEIVIVDQSSTRWPDEKRSFGLPVTYIHTDVRGAVFARNLGASIAIGKVLAFIDDDCLPNPEWLLNARCYLTDDTVVGVEGMVISDHINDPNWRPVTNVGTEGIGFMTANLMIRSAAFQILGGFDRAFDNPHFREDTDMGWRLQEIGKIPYARDVVVFHPAHPRSDERESLEARAYFFQKDAFLYKKHPERYRELFYIEQHFVNYPGFCENLTEGFRKISEGMPTWMKKELSNVMSKT